ncbi:MAG TPA: hypothetical protein VKS22_12300 [Candidatus Binataceae bacterium]|nr:hypothetical protein [Candidatus Binataceae bacterium]
MKLIEIDDQLYDFLVARQQRFNESPTEVIWRELKSGEMSSRTSTQGQNGAYIDVARDPLGDDISAALEDFLGSSEKMRVRDVKSRFLEILSWIAQNNPRLFAEAAVPAMNNRASRRKYISTSKRELEEAGKSANVHPIPGTEYWFDTRNSTSRKKEILAEALGALGFGPDSVRTACGMLGSTISDEAVGTSGMRKRGRFDRVQHASFDNLSDDDE